jgi:hypothetical protein
MHLLGCALHPNSQILSNQLFEQIAQLIVEAPRDSAADPTEIDVMTTNVDCGLEQNIAWAIENLSGRRRAGAGRRDAADSLRPVRQATIETIVDFRPSARWERTFGGSGEELHIRLWKLHGCLRDLKIQLSGHDHGNAETARQVLSRTRTEARLFGYAPTDELASTLADWRQTHPPEKESRPYRGVFSQSEYFSNLLMLARGELGRDGGGLAEPAPHDEQLRWMKRFSGLLADRPLIFVGYSIPEVDVDANAWLEPQLASLRSLAPAGSQGAAAPPADAGRRTPPGRDRARVHLARNRAH